MKEAYVNSWELDCVPMSESYIPVPVDPETDAVQVLAEPVSRQHKNLGVTASPGYVTIFISESTSLAITRYRGTRGQQTATPIYYSMAGQLVLERNDTIVPQECLWCIVRPQEGVDFLIDDPAFEVFASQLARVVLERLS